MRQSVARDILAHRLAITLGIAPRAGVALELARELRPDLILLDLHLPDMPGEELLPLLRAEPGSRDVPVVALSADATAHHMNRLRAAGVAAYLTKPVAVGDLLVTLDRLLPTAPNAPLRNVEPENQ
ncbi:MAG TPA: response regulator [Actinoplanes sp.]